MYMEVTVNPINKLKLNVSPTQLLFATNQIWSWLLQHYSIAGKIMVISIVKISYFCKSYQNR